MNFYDVESAMLSEATTRYSVEVNYRTTAKEMKEGFAKLVLTYISAAVKQRGYHTKKVFDQEPIRIIVSTKNWVDGEWVYVISYHSRMDCFIISKGFYNKDRDTVTIQDSSEKCDGDSAAEIFKSLSQKLEKVREEPPHHVGGLKPVKGKTGPTKGSMRPTQKYQMKKDIQPSTNDKMGM